MKAYHQYASAGTKVKIICKGYISQKMAISGAQTYLVFNALDKKEVISVLHK